MRRTKLTRQRYVALLGLLLLIVLAGWPGSSRPHPAYAEGPGNPDLGLPPADRAHFEQLSLEAGLSQSVVLCILQDHQGFLWIGTQDGLNRYDGYEFKVYRHDPGDPHTLSDNLIWSLHEDREGVLWVGTNSGGLNRFDRASETFHAYQNDPDDPHSLSSGLVSSIYEDDQGVLWVGTFGGGVNRFDRQEEQFTHYQNDPNDPHSLAGNQVNSIYQDQSGELWFGTTGGLDRLDRRTEQFVHYTDVPVQSLHQDSGGVLWIGTIGSGLGRLEPSPAAGEGAETLYYQHAYTDPHSLSDNHIWAILEGRNGALWLATNDGGLERFDRQEERFIHYRHDPDDPRSLANDQLRSLYEDRGGVLWIGTFGGGLSKYDRGKAKFPLYQSDPVNPNSLSSSQVWAIHQDREGDLWVGTFGGGLNRYDRNSGQFIHYQNDPDDAGSLGGDNVMAIHEDHEGTLWVGLFTGGLDRFDRETASFVHYTIAPVTSICQDHDGTIWLGTNGQGLARLDREAALQGDRAPFTLYQNDPSDPGTIRGNAVSALHVDRDGIIWVGLFGAGLERFDPRTGQFIHFQPDPQDPHSLSHDIVLSLYEDRAGALWVGTSAGLNRFDRTSGTFSHYDEGDGLPNEVIYGILGDDAGNLWMSTNVGLSKFDPDEETFRNYDLSDGLQSNEFNQGACYRDPSGRLYFGGINGLNAFYPEEIQDNRHIPPIVITEFQLFNEPVEVGGDSPLQQAINEAHEIALTYQDDFFTFQFAALDFAAPEKNRYAYILEGLDKGWNDVGNRRFAGYTNVPPGRYTFRVKGSNGDGVWNETGASIEIVVTPPFWQTWWFRTVTAALVVGSVAGGVLLRIRSIEAQRRRLAILVDERTRELQETLVELRRAKEAAEDARAAAEAANRAKSVFLANMSHELRTPLNAILGFTQLMGRDAALSAEQRENVGIINRSGEHLLGLINSVLEMSKIEAGRATLNQENFDLYHLLDGLEEMFRLRAQGKGLALSFERNPDVPRHIRADEGKLRQILMNLLGNAVKFTQRGGVALRVSHEEQTPARQPGSLPSCRLRFEIEDTGPGIPPEDIERIFDPFVQSTSAKDSLSALAQVQEGTGLGLSISQQFARLMEGEISVSSTLGRGSTFQLHIPVGVVGAGEVRAAQLTHRPTRLAPGQPAYRLLIVDDKEVNRKLLVKLLEPLGFQLREAAHGAEAIALWEIWNPHLILMDMRMPVMDGYEATRRIKATTKGQATMIVAVTASALEEDRTVILSEGCDAYIRKPFQEAELFDTLGQLLGLDFVYEETPARPQRSWHPSESPPDTPIDDQDALIEALATLPSTWVLELQEATIVGDQGVILLLIDQIRDRQPGLAKQLAGWAYTFEHDHILALIQRAEERDEQPED